MADPQPKTIVRKGSSALSRSDRVALVVPIVVRGVDSQGSPFEDKSQTLVISRYGVLIVLHRLLAPGHQLALSKQATLHKLHLENPTVAVYPMTGEIETLTAAGLENKRTTALIDLRTDGCIRTAQYGEDIVQTEDLSDSGARFNSRNHD